MLAVTKAIFIILLLGTGTLLGGSNPLPTELNRVLHASWRIYSRHHIQADARVPLDPGLARAWSGYSDLCPAYFPCF